jgi:hypothetical protein
MPVQKFGVPVPAEFKRQANSSDPSAPDWTWAISEDTRKRIEEIENNSRKAELQVGRLLQVGF